MKQRSLPAATRRTILDLLKREGPQDAEFLAQQLNITAMAVRQHLYALQDEGLISWESEAQGRGRPKKLWALTEGAEKFFPDAHQDLAVELIEAIQTMEGGKVMAKLLETRGAQQVTRYKKALDAYDSLKAKAQGLAKLRSKEGYMADIEVKDGVLYLYENHCPICSAARACSGICANELDVFQTALGAKYRVTREDHILAGARRCAYRIEER
ncbi:MAG: ArsR family transcriptional regulator [Sphingomonadales bacterium]|jgi:predicted ArsR family transcriptional regulator